MEIDPEVHAHAHKAGHRWIDLILAVCALALSVTSIIIALENDKSMHQLVTANSWPYVEFYHGNVLDGRPIIHLDARNAGIGPAMLEKLVVTYAGTPVGNDRELLNRCCGVAAAQPLALTLNVVSNAMLAPREVTTFLSLERTESTQAVWERLNVERFKLEIAGCYTSVFGEHWITSLRQPHPRTVKSCDELVGPGFNERIFETGGY